MTETSDSETTADSGRSTWLSVVIDVVVPVAIFYLLRVFGVDQVLALLAGGAAPAARGIWFAVRRRSFDTLAGLTLSVIVLTVITSLVTGDARFALARDAVITLAVGGWILFTLRRARPFIYSFCVTFMGSTERRLWIDCWDRSARFRHGMRVHTLIWGIGMIVDAAIRVVIAYTLPVDSVPLINAIQYAVLICALLIISVLYSRAAGLVPGSPDYPAKPDKTSTKVKEEK